MDKKNYDIIIVGSGNGACGFLSHYIQVNANSCRPQEVLVIEEGVNFFETSDIAHQNNWTQSYGQENIFKLHNALSSDGTPIISGHACTMGGGGSINYTMIHESSEWLSQHLGKTIDYWDKLKAELDKKFESPDLPLDQSPVTKHVLRKAQQAGFQCSISQDDVDGIRTVPSYPEGNANVLHIFPTQFDQFGQRTYSGVSLVDWFNQCVELRTRCRAVQLEFSNDSGENARCVGVQVEDLDTGKTECVSLAADHGKLILCAGAATPRLLLPHKEKLRNHEIGQHVSDHICMPLGIYLLDKDIKVTGRDSYIPVFATTVTQPKQAEWATVCCFDFFAGEFRQLWFFISHLYLTFLLPNWVKKVMIRSPWLFWFTKSGVRLFILCADFIIENCMGLHNLRRGKPWNDPANLITAIVKFNPATEGSYSSDGSEITLGFFEGEHSHYNVDKEIAKSVITEQLALLSSLGEQPNWLFKSLFRLFTKIPYGEKQVEHYVNVYSKRFLLSEQHLSGGCLFGKAIDTGLNNAADTGRVFGSANVYVADLSSVPLPRVSPQMTAYLIGFHISKMLCSENS